MGSVVPASPCWAEQSKFCGISIKLYSFKSLEGLLTTYVFEGWHKSGIFKSPSKIMLDKGSIENYVLMLSAIVSNIDNCKVGLADGRYTL